MPETENWTEIRHASRAFEAALPTGQRKKLGQFFTGIPLGKLLAHLALDAETRSVIDPMAGHGDLLDATLEAARERDIELRTLDGIEIDDATATLCRERLSKIGRGYRNLNTNVVAGNAFVKSSIASVSLDKYDLVITNPPYVRYQQQNGTGGQPDLVRKQLCEIIDSTQSRSEKHVFRVLAESYSGLADLSVPAWILASTLVKQGGRIALVVPATWRNRDYADVIRYLLLRCFTLECVVEDAQPGWFSSALVRTNLIVARKLDDTEIERRVFARKHKVPDPHWVQVSPEAAHQNSLVGTAFHGNTPEYELARWVSKAAFHPKPGISVRPFSLLEETSRIRQKIGLTGWCRKLEGEIDGSNVEYTSMFDSIPSTLKDVLSCNKLSKHLVTLEGLGIRVGQGLRTGCNGFFYVTVCETSRDDVLVQASDLFNAKRFSVPSSALRPVLRRQSEIEIIQNRKIPAGRVLDLRRWVLPEDYEQVLNSKNAYKNLGAYLPKYMPDELAEFVRKATDMIVGDAAAGKKIPDLSAVRTNVRIPKNEKMPPRFWYMLPDFSSRHVPAAFVARINHSVPWVEANLSNPILIDANFSVFWSERDEWTPHALKALLNSSWCRTYMESIGTQFGGGALKLEATHLRQIIVPKFSPDHIAEFTRLGKRLVEKDLDALSMIDELVFSQLIGKFKSNKYLASSMLTRARELECARRKVA